MNVNAKIFADAVVQLYLEAKKIQAWLHPNTPEFLREDFHLAIGEMTEAMKFSQDAMKSLNITAEIPNTNATQDTCEGKACTFHV